LWQVLKGVYDRNMHIPVDSDPEIMDRTRIRGRRKFKRS